MFSTSPSPSGRGEAARISGMLYLTTPSDLEPFGHRHINTAQIASIAPQNISLTLRLVVPYLVYAYSNDFPFLANAFRGQDFASPTWKNISDSPNMDVVSWFAAPYPLTAEQILPLTPPDLTSLANTNIVSLYEQARVFLNDLSACTSPNGNTTFLCQAFNDNSLWNAMKNDINFPTVLCHSKMDDVVGYVNIDPNNTNKYVTQYSSPLPALAIRGDHNTALILCALDPTTTIAFAQGSDTPITMTPLSNPPASCSSQSPTNPTPTTPGQPTTPSASPPNSSPTPTSTMSNPTKPSSAPRYHGTITWFGCFVIGWLIGTTNMI